MFDEINGRLDFLIQRFEAQQKLISDLTAENAIVRSEID